MMKGTPELITERREEIINACEKLYQATAMKEAGINYVYQTVYELTYGCLIRLLGE